MNKLFIASLLTLSAIASAQPTPPTPPAPPDLQGHPMRAVLCTATGGVLFEESFEVEARPELNAVAEKTWRITVYADGAWQRHEVDASGKHPSSSNGCLAGDQLTTIKTELGKAKWIVKQHDLACAAVGTTFTSFSVDGKAVWAEHMCQTAYLDDASAKALQVVRTLVEKVAAPPTMPCCKH